MHVPYGKQLGAIKGTHRESFGTLLGSTHYTRSRQEHCAGRSGSSLVTTELRTKRNSERAVIPDVLVGCLWVMNACCRLGSELGMLELRSQWCQSCLLSVVDIAIWLATSCRQDTWKLFRFKPYSVGLFPCWYLCSWFKVGGRSFSTDQDHRNRLCWQSKCSLPDNTPQKIVLFKNAFDKFEIKNLFKFKHKDIPMV